VWLNDKAPGIIGSAIIGTLQVIIPATANPSSSYRIHFEHASASPNGFSRLPKQVFDGLLTNSDHSASSFGDGIADTWRLRYFGSVRNHLSQAAADADGDGLPNWAEFKAGTNPNDVQSSLRMLAEKSSIGHSPSRGLTLRWPSATALKYTIEVTQSITESQWVPVASNIPGTGAEMEFMIDNPPNSSQFYRVRLAD
jgi:hypothetical protein